MLSQTQGQGCTAPGVGRLSLSLSLALLPVACSAEMCQWQRPLRPEGNGTLLVDSDSWLWKTHLASCTEVATTCGIRRQKVTKRSKWLAHGSDLNQA